MIDEERSAIMEFDGNLPRDWADGLARLCGAQKPEDYSPDTWADLVEDACRLMFHAPALLRNGFEQSDIRALLPQIKGRSVVKIGIGDVTVMQNGSLLKLYRRPRADGTVYWTEGRRA